MGSKVPANPTEASSLGRTSSSQQGGPVKKGKKESLFSKLNEISNKHF